MKTEATYIPGTDLLIIGADGKLDISNSKAALKKIVSHPDYNQNREVLFDLRNITCDISPLDIYDIVSFMSWPDSEFPTRNKIAVVVSDNREFDHARFFETCARNKSLRVKSFNEIRTAGEWLQSNHEKNNDCIDAVNAC